MNRYTIQEIPREAALSNLSRRSVFGKTTQTEATAVKSWALQLKKITNITDSAKYAARDYKQGHDDCVAGRTPPLDHTPSYLEGYSRVSSRLDA